MSWIDPAVEHVLNSVHESDDDPFMFGLGALSEQDHDDEAFEQWLASLRTGELAHVLDALEESRVDTLPMWDRAS
jgi:hypothetical protein